MQIKISKHCDLGIVIPLLVIPQLIYNSIVLIFVSQTHHNHHHLYCFCYNLFYSYFFQLVSADAISGEQNNIDINADSILSSDDGSAESTKEGMHYLSLGITCISSCDMHVLCASCANKTEKIIN